MERYTLSDTAWIDQLSLPEQVQVDFNELWNSHPDEFGTVFIHGKLINTPRWQQSYGNSYIFSGIKHEALPFNSILQELLEWANATEYGPFNQAVVNWYQDGSHYIGAHRDNESQMTKDSPVLAISFGETRTFRIREHKTKEKVLDIPLENRAVVVMGGATNSDFTHEIVKVNGKKGTNLGARISVTFRNFKC